MEDSGVVKLYEPSPTPCMYVALVEYMVGRVPLMPLFLAGNATLTIPHLYSKRKESGFLLGCADATAVDGRRGSGHVYKVNQWLWQLGRGKPCLHQQTGGLLLPIIAISIYYTHYGTIIRYYGAIIAIIVLQMSRLLFTIIALSPKRLLLHLWQYYYFTYCFLHTLLL